LDPPVGYPDPRRQPGVFSRPAIARAGVFVKSTGFRDRFSNVADACAPAQAIVDTVSEPVLVLDTKLRVIAASSFQMSCRAVD